MVVGNAECMICVNDIHEQLSAVDPSTCPCIGLL